MASTPKHERLLNLVIALMSARDFVPAEYLRGNVAGYRDQNQSDDSFKRMLERDKNELRELGIPVTTGRNRMGVEGYRIAPDEYALPDITLAPDEAAAVAAAAAVWNEPDVAVVSQTAVLKLQAAGIDVVAPGELGVEQIGGPRSVGSQTAIRALLDAIGSQRAVSFEHRGVTRRLEPWGVVGNRRRWYVVGHDLDREDVRTFRISRISDVVAVSDPGTVQVPPGTDVNALVEDAVSRTADGTATRARIWAAADRAHGLRRMAVASAPHALGDEPGDILEIDVTSRSGIIRAVLSSGADAVVLEPADLRAAVLADLNRLAAPGGER